MVYTDKVRRFYEITSYLPFYFRLKISFAAEEAQNGAHYPCPFLHSLNAFKGEPQDKSPIVSLVGDAGTVVVRTIYKSGVGGSGRCQTLGCGYGVCLFVDGAGNAETGVGSVDLSRGGVAHAAPETIFQYGFGEAECCGAVHAASYVRSAEHQVAASLAVSVSICCNVWEKGRLSAPDIQSVMG